jgi:hypothetical protein
VSAPDTQRDKEHAVEGMCLLIASLRVVEGAKRSPGLMVLIVKIGEVPSR